MPIRAENLHGQKGMTAKSHNAAVCTHSSAPLATCTGYVHVHVHVHCLETVQVLQVCRSQASMQEMIGM